MDKRYEVYCMVDPSFYDAPTRAADAVGDFGAAHAPVPGRGGRPDHVQHAVAAPTSCGPKAPRGVISVGSVGAWQTNSTTVKAA